MQNLEKKTISLEEIEEIVTEVLKSHTYSCGGIIIPGPKFEECIYNHLVRYFNSKRHDCQETNAEGEDSQSILLRT